MAVGWSVGVGGRVARVSGDRRWAASPAVGPPGACWVLGMAGEGSVGHYITVAATRRGPSPSALSSQASLTKCPGRLQLLPGTF